MSTVVTYHSNAEGIAWVKMCDQQGRNTFTFAIIEGLQQVFAEINANKAIKVVIIHGYDSYFACGGTKEELMKIFNNELTFNDLAFYKILLDCRCPCIAAMQGHTIGGGLAFACYADFLVFSSTHFYAANFMKYGFTPGMGATYLLPKKLGDSIANTLMYSAENYQGKQLQTMGLQWPVVESQQVLTKAEEIASAMLDKPELSLSLLKKQLNKEIVAQLSACIEDELQMHELTFANPEVKQRIERLFGH